MMDSLFQSVDYRKFLKSVVEQRRSQGLTNSQLSGILGCQAAYLSQVLGGKADLTEDHLLLLCEHLEFNDIETEYLLVLLRHAKAGNNSLREYLLRQREKLKRAGQELAPKVGSKKKVPAHEVAEYYTSSWIPSVLHLATSCEGLQTAPALTKKFKFDLRTVLYHLQKLESYGLVKQKGSRWTFEGDPLHFSKDSSFRQQLQLSRRLLALHNLTFRKEVDLHYSAIFATDKATAVKIRAQLVQFISGFSKTVGPTPSESVHAICIDCFSV